MASSELEPSMTRHLTPQNLQQLQDSLQARRTLLAQQNNTHLGGQSRVDHARELLLQDGDDDTQRDAEREVDLARTDRDAMALAEIRSEEHTSELQSQS